MEADWSVALSADDPAIEVPWTSFVDLRRNLDRIDEIAEAQVCLPLRSALLALNSAESPFFTAKCDVWSGAEGYDPYEMDAEPGKTAFGAGSYIDLLARDLEMRASFTRQEQWLRRVTGALRAVAMGAARVDLVLRPAEVDGQPGFGVSWFVEACAETAEGAARNWAQALKLGLEVIQSAG